jgi:Raf kinase inhibitor-like YbhB/YbcL family protein
MNPASQGMTLYSPALAANGEISPDNYLDTFGCSGRNLRPPLAWDGVPERTQSLALTFYDQDAPTGSGFWHWVAYNLSANLRELPTGPLPAGAVEGNTDFGVPGYYGPCPPVGRRHRYTFYLHALDVTSLEVPANATAALSGFFIYQHTIERASFTVLAGPRRA